MPSNKLFTNVITATAIVASMATTIGAGIKVAASRNNQEIEVPEVVAASPLPTATPVEEEIATPIPTDNPLLVTQVASEVSASPSDFPVASMIPGAQFDDDEDEEDEDEDELEKDDHEDEKDEDEESEDN